ncbi:putative polyketide synthase [Aspergillus undulatus]|uniref:putative polyketide synthase n=1 Tax=Aspergillus undulatus TaxID=1810928 RepID=UPI003CCE040F
MAPTTNEPIAIIGSGCRFPGGANSPSRLWDLLREPRDCRAEIPKDRFNWEGYYTKGARQGKISTKYTYFLDDIRSFDPQFFNIQPAEAESIDPQQRLLLETVYEGLGSAGLTLESLQGSSTAVYVGLMSCDFLDLVQGDADYMPKYTGSGISRSIDSNRISYFFDWNGPSMTIDTACSSSMVAVHLAVQSLRSGESTVAVACGANLIITPPNYVTLSNLKMISPDGRVKMWDAAADGYARGEGVAAIVLKPLSAAIADGDPIDCVIRETGVNTDGRTRGLTMPSSGAQAELIQKTYQRAGLDLSKREDRPQYFEAHGTGTKVGDPREAEAVHNAFFAGREDDNLGEEDFIHIGSIKTIIGHTEGTAGLAGLLKASLAIRHGYIPPNMHFSALNPAVAPYTKHLRLSTALRPWPVLPEGVPRRASVNSFGFGGSNGHAILESYGDTIGAQPQSYKPSSTTMATPFVFSANSEKSLISMLAGFSDFLKSTAEVDLRSVAWTLQHKRTTLSVRAAIIASSMDDLFLKLSNTLREPREDPVGVKPAVAARPRILGIFTGQGSQWVGMAQDLLQASPKAREIMRSLDESLSSLPRSADRPPWTIEDELMKLSPQTSRLGEAEISQPLRTAVQILLVDMLHSAGVQFHAVVGHSSGEIGAAYAARLIKASDAIRIAYYRGLYAKLAGNGQAGAMMAAGLSPSKARDICALPAFDGRLCVAAYNSPVSVTFSGDREALNEVKAKLEKEGIFARLLNTDTAYHSHHMLPCVRPYLEALQSCGIRPASPRAENSAPIWLSSVYPGEAMSAARADLSAEYWVTNMTRSVLFAGALEATLRTQGPFDAALEIGPHPALQSPVQQTIQDISDTKPPYSGVMSRGKNDLSAFSEALGMLWTHCKQGTVDFARYDETFFPNATKASFIRELPTYPWDHERQYWFESRSERARRSRPGPVHPLLGVPYGDATDTECRWRNFLISKEIPWLLHHRIQGRAVLPGAAYAAMACEAAIIKAQTQEVRLIGVHDLVIHQAISFDDDTSGVEVVFTLSHVERKQNQTPRGPDLAQTCLSASWTVQCPASKETDMLDVVCSGSVSLLLGPPSASVLPSRSESDSLPNMVPVDVDEFYGALSRLGYGYTGPFRTIGRLERKMRHSSGSFEPQSPHRGSFLHPALLDTALQALPAAISHPGDEGLGGLQVPTRISAIRLNPYHCYSSERGTMSFAATIDKDSGFGDVTIYTAAGDAFVQVESVETVPFTQATEADDRKIFSEEIWDLAEPDAGLTMTPEGDTLHDLYGQPLGLDAASTCVAPLVKQISHRHPRMHILEIGISTGFSTTKAILEQLGSAFKSYTRMDASGDSSEKTHEIDSAMRKKVVFARFDIEKDPSSQGFDEHSYDLVVASNVIHTAGDIHQTLRHVRTLLRPGGYMLLLEQAAQEPSGIGSLMGEPQSTFPDHRTGKRSFSTAQWHNLLRRTGFSGIDTISEPTQSEVAAPFVVVVSQAVDDQITFLRQPLFHRVAEGMDAVVEDLLIVGGMTLQTSRLSTEVQLMLAHRFRATIALETLEEVNHFVDGNTLPTTILVLTELEAPLFLQMTAERLKAVKTLFANHHNVLWVTGGCRSSEPYNNMTIGLGRSASNEQRDLRLQFLEIDERSSAGLPLGQRLSEMVLRLRVTQLWEREGTFDKVLWTTEPEYRLSHDNRLMIPRMYQSEAQNDRYNSKHRRITYKVAPTVNNVSISYSKSPGEFKLVNEPSPSRISRSYGSIAIRVSCSFLSALRVADGQYLFPVLGRRLDTDDTVFSLSISNSSLIQVPEHYAVSVKVARGQEKAVLLRLAWEILLNTVISTTTKGGVILTLGTEAKLLHSLRRRANEKGADVMTVTDDPEMGEDVRSIFIHPLELKNVLKAKVPSNVSAFLSLSSPGYPQNDLHERLVSVLPTPCPVHTADTLFSPSSVFSGASFQDASQSLLLGDMLADVTSAAHEVERNKNDSSSDSPAHTPGQVPQLNPAERDPFTIVDWVAEASVPVEYELVDRELSFAPDKTYLLVGLTGDLGQSLCEWFVEHGAKNVVLTSRDPKIGEKWLSIIKATGATIKVIAMDVTDKASVQAVYEEIRQTLPPIAGVANGAMVLRDMMLSNMELDDLLAVVKPKVDGSRYLHEIFEHDHPLDFFILFSSLSAVVGNSGQSNYAAANAYMTSLVAQRRAQGLAGSVMHIGPIIGAGYITRLGQSKFKDLATAGLYPLSVADFHQVFGEAVLASPATSGRNMEITTGLRAVDSESEGRVLWRSNPRFSRFLKDGNGEARHSDHAARSIVSVKVQLAEAKSKTQAGKIIQEYFSTRLIGLLQLDADSLDANTPLLELGVDSLVAVEVRSWFTKHLNVNVSVLRILGGASVVGLVEDAMEQLSPQLLPMVKSEVDEGQSVLLLDEASIGANEGAPTGYLPSSVPSAKSSDEGLRSSRDGTPITPSSELDENPMGSDSMLLQKE